MDDPYRSIDLDRIYAAVDDETAFAGLPDALAAECGGRSAMILYDGGAGGSPVPLINYWPAAACARYHAEFIDADPWVSVHNRHGDNGGVLAGDAFLSPDAYRRTTIYNELIRPLGDDTARCLGMVLNGAAIRFQIGVHRAGRQPAFGREDEERLALVKPHLERVFMLRGLLAQERRARLDIEAMIDAGDRAMLCVDEALRIRRASAAAVALLDRRDGLAVSGGRLACPSADAMATLRRRVRATATGRAPARSGLSVPRPGGGPAYRLAILPTRPAIVGHALIVIDDPAAGDPDRIALFAQIYGSTAAETALVRGLLDGRTLDEIAAHRGVTRETVRTQLRMLFARTGTNRQSSLMRLIAGLPGPGGGVS